MNYVEEVVNILFLSVFDSKIVNNEGEGDVTIFVEEEARCTTGFDVAKVFEVFDHCDISYRFP